ncbi:glycosyltransferase family 2 protein [Chryseotalea sanaruensis]|uniref:Glycosyltransferase family 2 protein n=1 Tax=Chryseotalea sanaruensis TaxID=2482724 RepID=A0A401U4X2_9BACT|nr:glycosyltransferase family 2 protein [Chryseotalea sanaruensis]GCC49932.1 glycosyltransferase family 2 protein [Chryseotalea sanaruensis]
MSTVAVVILNYNGEHFLRQFLPAVIEYSNEAEIIVADNASTDQSITILTKEFPTVRLIQLKNNFGFCGGYNRALQEVNADYYVLLNSDVEVTALWLQPVVQFLDNNLNVAAVQPKIKSFHNKEYFEYAGAAGGFIDSLGYPFCRGRIFDELEKDLGQYNDTKEIFWATGACMVVRSKLYHQLGGLDEDFFAHMEEIDLCWRLKRQGHSIYYVGDSTVYHVGGGTLAKVNPKKTYLNFRNGLSLLIKNLTFSALLWKLPFRVMLDYVAALRFLLTGQGKHAWAIVCAHGDVFFVKLGSTLSKRTSSHNPRLTGIYSGLLIWQHFIEKRKPSI